MERNHRRSIRLKGFDYSQPGYYFVTVCTWGRECVLGKIYGSVMLPNTMGKIASKIGHDLPNHFANIEIDRWLIMPNHLHGIIRVLEDNQNKDADKYRGLMNQTPTVKKYSDRGYDYGQWIMMKKPEMTLGKVIRFFKAKSALEIRNKLSNSFSWQRNYFEHIIRDQHELFRIRDYILENPAKWMSDEDNPCHGKEK